MWEVIRWIAVAIGVAIAFVFSRTSMRVYRQVLADHRARAKRMEERHVWRAHVAIVHTERGRSVILPTEEYEALVQRLTANRAMIIPTDDEIGIVMYGRNVYPEGLAPAQMTDFPF